MVVCIVLSQVLNGMAPGGRPVVFAALRFSDATMPKQNCWQTNSGSNMLLQLPVRFGKNSSSSIWHRHRCE